jgi:hypothetical protein
MTDTTENQTARSRAYGTTEERKVLALESIADQLRLLVAIATPVDRTKGNGSTTESERANVADESAWENEGSSLDREIAASLGIKPVSTEQFETGGYRYTKLADAIAEAKRTLAR